MESFTRPELIDFQGVSMTDTFINDWENIQNFKARPDDILIATYPKAGTTWVSYILDLLYFGKKNPERETLSIYERVPFLEMNFSFMDSGVQLAENLTTSPRLIKTHLPVHFVPKSFWEQKCKVVYVARNAKDLAVSFYHFHRMNKGLPEPGDWSSFLQNYTDGKMLFGSWYDHVNGWWEKKQTCPNIHYMFYEDLAEDVGLEFDKLCSFLSVSPSIEKKKEILEGTRFDKMKNNSMINHSVVPVMDFKISHFMRKGKVGDWKTHFTVAQNEVFDEHYKTKMKDSTLKFRTEI
ncbi:cytosolic sulfotransferase 2-like [Nelusetta ayraudi]|uniref:cytosolic sulfotransferase 2-like n=1 Tax=Nelusetta ayraudi TaxID=303726 RepID=UPI003F6F1AD3